MLDDKGKKTSVDTFFRAPFVMRYSWQVVPSLEDALDS